MGSRDTVDDWGNITGLQTTISIQLLPTAPKHSDILAGG